MPCADQQFQADFFNNVAAVAMVLVFAKVFAHRFQKKQTTDPQSTDRHVNLRAGFHAVAVLGAVAAAVASLWATERGSDWISFHLVAWGGLIIAGIVFVGEIYVDDVEPHLRVGQRLKEKWRRREGKAVTDSAAK